MPPITPRPIIVRAERSNGAIVAVAIVIGIALIAIAYMALNQPVSTNHTTIIEKPAVTALPVAPAAPVAPVAPVAPNNNVTIHNDAPPKEVIIQHEAPPKEITINNTQVTPKEDVLEQVPAQ